MPGAWADEHEHDERSKEGRDGKNREDGKAEASQPGIATAKEAPNGVERAGGVSKL